MNFNTRRSWGPEPKYPVVQSIPPHDVGMITIAGPCSIEDERQIDNIAKELKRTGVTYMRGGIFRAGTYPPKEFGLQYYLLKRWAQIAHNYGLKIITEVLYIRDIDIIDNYTDAFQIGARHMQDYVLLDCLSKIEKPVTLKRNMGATLDEFLGAAEYLVRNGKRNVILIERGSSTHMNHVRWDLSLSIIHAIKKITGLPILVDASHGTGRSDLVEPMTLAGMAAGADGFLLEIHPNPSESISDSDQAINLSRYETVKAKSEHIRQELYLLPHDMEKNNNGR